MLFLRIWCNSKITQIRCHFFLTARASIENSITKQKALVLHILSVKKIKRTFFLLTLIKSLEVNLNFCLNICRHFGCSCLLEAKMHSFSFLIWWLILWDLQFLDFKISFFKILLEVENLITASRVDIIKMKVKNKTTAVI